MQLVNNGGSRHAKPLTEPHHKISQNIQQPPITIFLTLRNGVPTFTNQKVNCDDTDYVDMTRKTSHTFYDDNAHSATMEKKKNNHDMNVLFKNCFE